MSSKSAWHSFQIKQGVASREQDLRQRHLMGGTHWWDWVTCPSAGKHLWLGYRLYLSGGSGSLGHSLRLCVYQHQVSHEKT